MGAAVTEKVPPPTTTTHHTIPPGLQPPAPEAWVTVGTGQPPHRKGSPWNLDKVSHWELSAPRGAAADQWTKPGPSGGRRTGTIGGQWQDMTCPLAMRKAARELEKQVVTPLLQFCFQ
ncbi:unnamed protein product [Arctogadus glacialis]